MHKILAMENISSCKIDSMFVFVIVAVIIIVTGSILSTVPTATQETDAVTRQHTKKTVCIDGICTTNETVIGNCPPSQCRSENSVNIK